MDAATHCVVLAMVPGVDAGQRLPARGVNTLRELYVMKLGGYLTIFDAYHG
jgi:hypothetical protein